MMADPMVRKHFPKRLNRAEAGQWMENVNAVYARSGMTLLPLIRRVDQVFLGYIGLPKS